MANRIEFHPQVAADIAAAISWYESRSPGLGRRFRHAVQARLQSVAAEPTIFPCAFTDASLRFVKVQRFPYLILFHHDGQVVYVVGIFHFSSDPGSWRSRKVR